MAKGCSVGMCGRPTVREREGQVGAGDGERKGEIDCLVSARLGEAGW